MPRDLADGVVAGVDRLLAGRAAVADVVGVGVGGAVDLEVEAARVGRRAQVLHDLELAGLAGVGDRADDVGAVVTGTFSGPASSAPSGRRDRLVAVVGSLQLIDFW